MKYSKLEYYLSEPRLDRFLLSCGNSKIRAKKLYRANIRIAQSFYPVLNLFETFLRNTINNQLSKYFNDPNWIISQKNGFMNSPTLKHSKFWLKEQIIITERNTRPPVTSGKIVSEQSFGVWTALFEPHYYKLIGGSVIHCFPNKPSHINRTEISETLKRIRKFRNRIYHNEAICFSDKNIDFTEAINIRKDIYNILSWIDEDICHYVESYDNIEDRIKHALNI